MHKEAKREEEEVIINSLEWKGRKGYYSISSRRKGIKTKQNSSAQSLIEI